MSLQDYVRRSVGAITGKVNELASELSALKAQNALLQKIFEQQPRSITREIDKINGRRVMYNLTGVRQFGLADEFRRGQPVNMLVSQDGPFIQTHYPFALWRPTQPDPGATNLGLWRPVTPFPLPVQGTSGANDLNQDIISISYELTDGGSQRNMQNLPVPPILSRPDNVIPLPVPMLWTPNSTVQFYPTYHRILFNGTQTPPTQGLLSVVLPGYRIVNM